MPIRRTRGSRLSLILLVASVAACASSGAGPLFPRPYRPDAELSPTEMVAIAEILMLEDHRRYDDAALERLAADPSVEVRRRAITAAGRIGGRAALPLLTGALAGDPEPGVRADAAFALGELGDTSAAVIRALGNTAPPSWVPVRDPEVAVVVEVLGALGKLGTPAAARLVGDALLEARPAVADNTRRVAAEALLASWRFGAATPIPRIAAFLQAEDPEIRWRAAYALMRSARHEGVPYLLGQADDDEHRVRAYAARALSNAAAERAGVADSARGVLTQLLSDVHPHVRINALGALASYGEAAPADAMAALLADRDANVAIAAASALGRIGERAATALAAASVDRARPMPVRGAALAELAPLDPARAVFVADAMSRGDPPSRYYAARALAGLEWADARESLRRLVADEDPRIAIAALGAAGSLASDTSLADPVGREIADVIAQGLESDDPRVVAAAAGALSPVVESRDVPRLLASYERVAEAATPGERAAAMGIIEALGALDARTPAAGAGPPARAAADAFFRRFPSGEDRWLRRAVADTLGDAWGGAPPAVAAEDLAFYRDVARRYVAVPLADGDRPIAEIRTASGLIEVELLAEEAPLTVANFVGLAREGYFDEGVWHRVVPNFVLQDGAAGGYASGGPGWAIRDEINRVRYDRGAVGMALSGPDTGGSQWFITHSPQPHLDGGYTVFGRVTHGMEVADRVVQGEPILSVRIR